VPERVDKGDQRHGVHVNQLAILYLSRRVPEKAPDLPSNGRTIYSNYEPARKVTLMPDVTIYFADLTHCGTVTNADTFPYGVGCIATYTKKFLAPKFRLNCSSCLMYWTRPLKPRLQMFCALATMCGITISAPPSGVGSRTHGRMCRS
jgi:hypothetical protein